jgi:hypothetical protein
MGSQEALLQTIMITYFKVQICKTYKSDSVLLLNLKNYSCTGLDNICNLCALWQQEIRPSTVHIIYLQGGVSHVACRIQVPDRIFSLKVNALQVEKEANQESLIGNSSMLQKSWADGYWNTIYQ